MLVHSLKDFEHDLASMWNECNCVLDLTFFGIALLWDWNENWPFPALWPLLSFPICWHIDCNTLTASSFRIWNSSAEFPGFPHSSVGKESACNAGDPSSIPGSGRSPGEGIGYSLQYSWASLVAQLAKNLDAMWEVWVGKIHWRRKRLPTPEFWPGEFHGLYSCTVRHDWATFTSLQLEFYHLHYLCL